MSQKSSSMTPHPAEQLEAVFNHVYQTRMAGLPIVNPVLRVEAVGFTAYQEGWLGIVITPWFMSLLYLLQGQAVATLDEPLQLGDTVNYQLPAGNCEFRVSHEDKLGRYLACPLFSPMGDFPNHESAQTKAQTILAAILEPPEATSPTQAADQATSKTDDDTPRPEQPTSPARRALFRKLFTRD